MSPSRSSAFPKGVRTPGRLACVLVLAMSVLSASGMAQRSPHGTLSVPCEQCHGAESWTVLLSPLKFAHASTGFSLQGQHAVVRCTGCHAALKFSGARNLCADCHDDVHRGELGKQCDRCHTPESWLVSDMVQKHKNTRFALVGAHAAATAGAVIPTSGITRSPGCAPIVSHAMRATTPEPRIPITSQAVSGPTARSAIPSTRCAGEATSITRPRNSRSQVPTAHFRARGAMSEAISTPPRPTAMAATDRSSPARPVRNTPDFSTACLSCHTTTAWRPASFDHNLTAFKLTGRIVRSRAPNVISTACIRGHRPCAIRVTSRHSSRPRTQSTRDLRRTARHVIPPRWRPASFDHNLTAFKLTGAHFLTPCASCHVGGVYTGTPSTCGSSNCHLPRYNATTNPPHAGAGFGTDCQTCHTTTAWTPSTFNHTPGSRSRQGASTRLGGGRCAPIVIPCRPTTRPFRASTATSIATRPGWTSSMRGGRTTRTRARAATLVIRGEPTIDKARTTLGARVLPAPLRRTGGSAGERCEADCFHRHVRDRWQRLHRSREDDRAGRRRHVGPLPC